MDLFPWAALIAAVSAITLAVIPLITNVGAESRMQKTVELLKAVNARMPDRPAAVSLTEAMNLMAARRLARLEHGGFVWFYVAGVASATAWISHLAGAVQLSNVNVWMSGVSALVFTIFSGYKYWRYANLVDKYRK